MLSVHLNLCVFRHAGCFSPEWVQCVYSQLPDHMTAGKEYDSPALQPIKFLWYRGSLPTIYWVAFVSSHLDLKKEVYPIVDIYMFIVLWFLLFFYHSYVDWRGLRFAGILSCVWPSYTHSPCLSIWVCDKSLCSCLTHSDLLMFVWPCA